MIFLFFVSTRVPSTIKIFILYTCQILHIIFNFLHGLLFFLFLICFSLIKLGTLTNTWKTTQWKTHIDPQFSNFNSLEEKWWEHEMNDGYETNESFNERSIQLRTFIFINNVLFPLYFTIDSHILNIYADIY